MNTPTPHASKFPAAYSPSTPTVNRPRHRFLARLRPLTTPGLAAVILAVLCAAATAQTNLLVDPGFETQPLLTYGNVLFNGTLGRWGAEAATLSGPDPSGSNPLGGSQMLRMTDSGGATTKTVQITDVASSLSLIDGGGATATLSAFFDDVDNLPLSNATISLYFFDASRVSTGSPISTSLTLNGFPNDWEQISTSGAIPIGTRLLISEVRFDDALLSGYPGFVDQASLTIAPEPSATLFLLGSGTMFLVRRRRAPSTSPAAAKQDRNH